jgi:hypothetical protein
MCLRSITSDFYLFTLNQGQNGEVSVLNVVEEIGFDFAYLAEGGTEDSSDGLGQLVLAFVDGSSKGWQIAV